MVKRRIFAWVTDLGCAHYRIIMPFQRLGERGWEVAWGSPPPNIHEYDVVIGQRIAGNSPEWLALCEDPNVLAVYDMDDDLLNIDPANEIPYSIYAPLAELTRKNVAAANVVTTCTPHVTRVMREINKNVYELPICTTPDVFDLPLLTKPGQLVIGWGGSQFHAQDWRGIPAVLDTYSRAIPHARFHMMGSDYTGTHLSGRKRTFPLMPITHHYARLDFDIGLAPLLKSFHNRGKSHTKLLEYGSRGIPAVATRWGQYEDWIEHGVNGMLVDEPGEWLTALLYMSDDTTRAMMSTEARNTARQFIINDHIHLWEKAYGV